MIDLWRESLKTSLGSMWSGVVQFVPNILTALIILLVGWAIGVVLSGIISQVMKSLKVDEALRKAGIDDFLRKGGINLNSGKFLGELVKWFVIVVFLTAVFSILGLTVVNVFLSQVILLYLPEVIVSVLMLIVAAVVGDMMRKVVVTSAKTAGIRSANLLGSFTKWAIWISVILVVLTQLGIAAGFIQTLFTGVVIALSLAFGLAFGLGGQEAAARFIEKTREEISGR